MYKTKLSFMSYISRALMPPATGLGSYRQRETRAGITKIEVLPNNRINE